MKIAVTGKGGVGKTDYMQMKEKQCMKRMQIRMRIWDWH